MRISVRFITSRCVVLLAFSLAANVLTQSRGARGASQEPVRYEGADVVPESPTEVINAVIQVKSFTDEDRTKIKALCEAYKSAWIANDQKAVLATLSADALLLPHHGHPPIRGLSKITEFWWPTAGASTTVTMFRMTTDEIGGHGNLGYVWGNFSLAFEYEEKGEKKSISNAGTYLMIVRRQSNGAWLITHRMWDDPISQER